ncbi:GntR family transcriptional regulator [Agromyces sp. CFH 90414]|uniref:GntR family transcriptional regulator n=1 Tax=Agromyces agglutinans TaxID=2662258 RepID=A0A6I2F639_9MICO|nr:GntR family transcriptional regulator [Agromyces agglutinans]MRG59761.1 GntR family transcriptional regulator [Agromyces agglutinans]
MIVVDPGSPTAPYEQIRVGIASAVRAGDLAPGERLPTVRALAADLDLAVNTVGKAYRELERDGVIETRGRLGSFVIGHEESATAVDEQARLAASDFVTRVAELGVEASDALALVRRALRLRD